MDFMNDLCNKCPWLGTETLHLSYYDSASKSYVSVKTDLMLLMFEKFKLSKYIELNGVFVAAPASSSQPTEVAEATNQVTRKDICPPDTYLENPFKVHTRCMLLDVNQVYKKHSNKQVSCPTELKQCHVETNSNFLHVT